MTYFSCQSPFPLPPSHVVWCSVCPSTVHSTGVLYCVVSFLTDSFRDAECHLLVFECRPKSFSDTIGIWKAFSAQAFFTTFPHFFSCFSPNTSLQLTPSAAVLCTPAGIILSVVHFLLLLPLLPCRLLLADTAQNPPCGLHACCPTPFWSALIPLPPQCPCI